MIEKQSRIRRQLDAATVCRKRKVHSNGDHTVHCFELDNLEMCSLAAMAVSTVGSERISGIKRTALVG